MNTSTYLLFFGGLTTMHLSCAYLTEKRERTNQIIMGTLFAVPTICLFKLYMSE